MTNKTKKENISYSSMAGELRKGARLYEVFKHASEAANILASYEREEESAKKIRDNLTKELSSLNDECDKAYNRQKDAEVAKAEADKEAVLILKKARVEAEGIKSKASKSAEKKVGECNISLDVILEKTRIARNEQEQATNSKNEALQALSKVEKQIQDARDRFLKTLG